MDSSTALGTTCLELDNQQGFWGGRILGSKYKIGEGHLVLSGSEFSLIVPAKIGGFYVLKFGCYSVTEKKVILCVLFSTREFTASNKECRSSAI